jgi:hypothetical protein
MGELLFLPYEHRRSVGTGTWPIPRLDETDAFARGCFSTMDCFGSAGSLGPVDLGCPRVPGQTALFAPRLPYDRRPEDLAYS